MTWPSQGRSLVRMSVACPASWRPSGVRGAMDITQGRPRLLPSDLNSSLHGRQGQPLSRQAWTRTAEQAATVRQVPAEPWPLST